MNEIIQSSKPEFLAFTPEQVDLLKTTVAKGATNDELKLFLHVCQKSGLDPFAKQIYAIKRKNRRTNSDEMSIQTGIDGYRVVAERTNRYAPGKEPTYTYDKEGLLVSATAHVNKMVGDKWFEVSATAFFKEYVQEGNYMWGKMPHVMLAKCAEALALRRAFPNELSGLYTQEEMAQADNSPSVQMPQRKVVGLPVKSDEPQKQEELQKNEQVQEGKIDPLHAEVDSEIEFGEPPADMDMGFGQRDGKKTINRAQQQVLFARTREAGVDEEHLKKAIQVLYNIDSTKNLTFDQFDNLLAMLKKGAIRGADTKIPTA